MLSAPCVRGVSYIVHVASPSGNFEQGVDRRRDVIEPAIQGTVNVLKAASAGALGQSHCLYIFRPRHC